MPEQPGQVCEVVGCGQPAAGSYLHLAGARSAQFAVCDAHLNQLKSGARPSVVADPTHPAERDGRPVLLLQPAREPLATGVEHDEDLA